MNSEEFSNFRSAFNELQRKTEKNLERESTEEWPIQDSGLLSSEENYSYNQVFAGLYPPEFASIKEYIEQRLAERKGKAIGIEIGGVGSKLFAEFSPGFFKKSVGTTLIDGRDAHKQAKDKENHHIVLEADMFSSKGQRELETWLGSEKADVVFEKMHGALLNFPNNTSILLSYLNRWYKLLNQKGIMFIQIPSLKEPTLQVVTTWLETIKNHQIPGLSLDYNVLKAGNNESMIHMRLEKSAEAPDQILQLIHP